MSHMPDEISVQVDLLISLADLQTRFADTVNRASLRPASTLNTSHQSHELFSDALENESALQLPHRTSRQTNMQEIPHGAPASIISAAISQKMHYVELAGSLYDQNAMLLRRIAILERKTRSA